MARSNQVLTSRQVADICNVASRTIQKWFDTGLLPGYRMPGSHTRRIPATDLVNFLNKYNMPIPQNLIQHAAQHASKQTAANPPRARKAASTARKTNIVSLPPKSRRHKKTTATQKNI